LLMTNEGIEEPSIILASISEPGKLLAIALRAILPA
jgi:hypothetical protein